MEGVASPFEEQVPMADPSSEAENSQGDSNSQDLQVTDQPEYEGYEQTSSANSRTSSPLPPVHFGITSHFQGNGSPPADQIENNESNNHQHSVNDSGSTNSLGSNLQGAKAGKKMNTVQNIVEGLRRKRETKLAKSKCNEPAPNIYKTKPALGSAFKKQEPAFPSHGKNTTFPISQNLQARLARERKPVSNHFKQTIARPKSPTGKSHGLFKDSTHFTYSMMESPVDDLEAAEIFNVQNHELVCAIGSKPLMSSKSNKVFASLDFGTYWCNFCPYTSSNKAALIKHVLEHRFSCKYCPYESFCRSDTMRHMHKMHPDFEDSASHFMYCTLLSDFLRIKARMQGKTTIDWDEDIGDPDGNDMDILSADHSPRKRKYTEDNLSDIKSVRSSLESPSATPTWSDSESSAKEKGKSRKSQNPKRHAPSNEIEHFDLFDVDVEEKNHPHTDSDFSEKISTLDQPSLLNSDSQPLPPGTMQMLPTMTDGSLQTFTSKEAEPLIPTSSSAPKANSSSRSRKNTTSTGSASNLYWSCGYCTFQSNGQSEIKDHSNKQHPGRPHRYVALIKNMTPDTYISHGTPSSNIKRSSLRPALSNSQTNGARYALELDDMKEMEDSPDLSSHKNTTTRIRREGAVYRCYHCSYTAKRHSSLKTHLYHKHRGKGLVAVEDESETGQQLFFCARDDCTFKSDNPNLYLKHVDQCTPWNKPELADVEVEPHIRECLDQTVAFAETAREKVNNQCLYETAVKEANQENGVAGTQQEVQNLTYTVRINSVSPELPGEGTVMGGSAVCLSFDNDSKPKESVKKVSSEDRIVSTPVYSESYAQWLKPEKWLDEKQHDEGKDICHSSSVEVAKSIQPIDSTLDDTISFEDSGHNDQCCSIEDSPGDNLKHSMSSEESFIAVGVVSKPVVNENDFYIADESDLSVDEAFVSSVNENSLNSNDIVPEACINRDHSIVCPLSSFKESQRTLNVSNTNIFVQDKSILPNGLIKSTEHLHTGVSERADGTMSKNVSDRKIGGESERGSLSVCRKKPVESEWLMDLIDSSTENTDSEESRIAFKQSVSHVHNGSQESKLQNIAPGRSGKNCTQIVTNYNTNVEILESQSSDNSRRVSSEPDREKNVREKELFSKLCFAYVPARSSAQKALSKMKSTLANESESDIDNKLDPNIKKMKQLPLKTKKGGVKFFKALGKAPMFQPRNSIGALSTRLPCSASARPKQFSSLYMCQYCLDIHPSSLKKIKAHLLLTHKNLPPSVINCSNQRKQKCKLFVCPYPSCLKLFFEAKDLDKHKNTHQTISVKRTKERDTFNSSSFTTASSTYVHDAPGISETKISTSDNHLQPYEITNSNMSIPTASAMPEIRSCRVKLHNLGASEVQAITQRHKREGKYLCLYCTEYVYESSLSAMKAHYIHEHEGQLMVMRDTEARRAQRPSRIYVCESPGCEHKCVSKNELDTHVRSEHHSSSSCSYVYQCVLCGWFSSSHASANQHLKSQHSPEEGASLIHMQVTVDEFGQTCKKIV